MVHVMTAQHVWHASFTSSLGHGFSSIVQQVVEVSNYSLITLSVLHAGKEVSKLGVHLSTFGGSERSIL